jgi:DNA-binding NarL/FixJ family response regulator
MNQNLGAANGDRAARECAEFMARDATPQKPATSILVVDDHPVVRESLALRISQEPDLNVCAEAGSFQTALAAVERHQPGVVILDMNLPDGHGLELIKEIRARWPSTRMLVFSMNDEMLYAERALRAGAQGYVMKSEAPDTVVDSLRQVMAGKVAVSGVIQQHILAGATNRSRKACSAVETLSDRELEVFRLLGMGLNAKEVAARLRLSAKTVETHRERIKHKLGIGSATELTAMAAQWRAEHPSD